MIYDSIALNDLYSVLKSVIYKHFAKKYNGLKRNCIFGLFGFYFVYNFCSTTYNSKRFSEIN